MRKKAVRGIDEADRFEIDGVEFVPSWGRPSRPGSLTLLKSVRMIPLYEELLRPFPSPAMVELGISQGGSVALLALLARPRKFVAIELDRSPIEPLTMMLEDRGLVDTVRPYFGVDQGDRTRLAEILHREFGGDPIDLVVDDASHLYEPTVASFEVLFPRLRSGGVYVIEDWTWQDLTADTLVTKIAADPSSEAYEKMMARLALIMEGKIARERPISRVALELALAVAQSTGAIDEVRLDENWIIVRRGELPLDPERFRIADLYRDHYRQLST